jgi:ATP phosphoribosyltransferase
MITLALSKGRIFEDTLPLLKTAGIEVLEDPEKSRKLILTTNLPDVRVLVVRATDVPTYVQYGGADLGITGKDTLIEHAAEWGGGTGAMGGGSTSPGLYQPLDLQIAKCRISVAVRADFDYASAVKQGSRLKVATKYVAIAREFFASKGVHVDLIKLYGSMELAPLTGLADAIVDLVSTGNTLKANHLIEVEHIMDISSRLIVNQAALKLKQAPIRKIIDSFAAAVKSANP